MRLQILSKSSAALAIKLSFVRPTNRELLDFQQACCDLIELSERVKDGTSQVGDFIPSDGRAHIVRSCSAGAMKYAQVGGEAAGHEHPDGSARLHAEL